MYKFSLKKVVSLYRGQVVGNTHLNFGFSMSELKLNIISTALQAFLFASSPHLLFTKTVCFYLLPLILPSADLLSAICKPSQGRRIKLNFPSTACLSSPHSIPLSVVLD